MEMVWFQKFPGSLALSPLFLSYYDKKQQYGSLVFTVMKSVSLPQYVFLLRIWRITFTGRMFSKKFDVPFFAGWNPARKKS